jgi:hypothetical protein
MKDSSVSNNTTCTTDSSSYYNDGSIDEATPAASESSSRIFSALAQLLSTTMTAIVAAVALAKSKTAYTRSMTWRLWKEVMNSKDCSFDT